MKEEALKKKIDITEEKVKFFRNMWLALVSSIIWSVYAILENKAGKEIAFLSGIGFIISILVFIRIKTLEEIIENLIEKLEKE